MGVIAFKGVFRRFYRSLKGFTQVSFMRYIRGVQRFPRHFREFKDVLIRFCAFQEVSEVFSELRRLSGELKGISGRGWLEAFQGVLRRFRKFQRSFNALIM